MHDPSDPAPPAPGGLPTRLGTEAELDEFLTRPSAALCESIQTLTSPLLVLGAGGKMGPSLAVLARRAAEAAGHPLEIRAVSRYRDPAARDALEAQGVQTISADLLDAEAVERLPDSDNVVYLVGLKFGTGRNPAATWAANTIIPWHVVERFPRARIVALSTGNVYPFTPVAGGGAAETHPLTPLGEYANAAVARERIFEWCSSRHATPVALFRLSYAVELRYGVLVDIARKVFADEPIDLGNSHFNCIWQGDANDAILRGFKLTSTPPSAWNLCRGEAFSVREVAFQFGGLFERRPKLVGEESGTALLSDTSRLRAALGEATVPLESMISWIAQWVEQGGRSLDRPTHFETRDGRY